MSSAKAAPEASVPPIGEDGLRTRLDGAYREADRILVSVSSGVLALSVPLVAKERLCELALWTIRIGWVLFLATILIVLYSLYVEQVEKKARLDGLGRVSDEIKAMSARLVKLNKVGLWTFGSGMVLLLIFLMLATLG